jgi:5-methylthioadenosine/S-adenosylhomocysteine deaminase
MSLRAMLFVALLSACGGRPFPGEDGGMPEVDAGPLPRQSEPTEPAEIVRDGSGAILLRGVVLAPDRVISPGEVLIVGTDIACVAEDCSSAPGAVNATIVETNGLISPGLIDAHNHLTYDFLPEWRSSTIFDNRYTWADDPSYEDHILPFSATRNENDTICPGAKWGELRSIVHATTTVQGETANRSCLDRLARNADHYHRLGYDHMRTAITSPREITDEDAASLVASFTDPTEPTTRYAVHMCEGVSGSNVELELASFAGRDTRTNRHMGIDLLAMEGSYSGVGLLIHGMVLTDEELEEVRAADGHIVWSPSSNLALYDRTAPIERMLEIGVNVGLGPDWTVSGDDEMLSEMRTAHLYGLGEGIEALTPERLWRMATEGSAAAVGLGDVIGRLEVGYRADVVVFGRRAADPYVALLESRAQDVRLVLIDGAGYYGDLALEDATAVNGQCDVLDACGASKYLCAAGTPGSTGDTSRVNETVDDIHNQLTAILDMYGRASELNELVACD